MNAILPSVSARCRTQARTRTLIRILHLSLGLSLGILLVTQGLSGSVLVWRPELERLMLPKSTSDANSRRSLDTEQAAIRRMLPQGTIRMVHLAETPGSSDAWNLTVPAAASEAGGRNAGARWTVYVAPSTATVIAVRGRQRDALSFLVELHHNLFSGAFGRAVLGYVAIATVLLALSGLWLWWPPAWTWARIRPRTRVKPLHYAIGFWAMGPLLIIAVTAIYFVWRQPIQHAFGIAGPQRASERPAMRERSGDRLHRDERGAGMQPAEPSLDLIMDAATRALPAERAAALRFPERPGGAYSVLFEKPDQHYRTAPDSVSVRVAPDGRAHVENVSLWSRLPLAQRFLEWLPRIHQAEVGGIPVRILWSLTGFMPALLYGTGFLMWRRRVLVAKTSSPQMSAR